MKNEEIKNVKSVDVDKISKADNKAEKLKEKAFVEEKDSLNSNSSNLTKSEEKQKIKQAKEEFKKNKKLIESKFKDYRDKIPSIKEEIKNNSISKIESEISDEEEKKKELKKLSKKLRNGYYPVDEKVAIKLSGAYKYYFSSDVITKVIDNLDLEIMRNEVTVILGPSGSGKTTLLNLISGLDKPSAGDVITNNYNLSWIKERKLIYFRKVNTSFIFQQYNLIPTLNVEDNIKTGFEIRNKENEDIDIYDLMKRINIYESRKKYPYQLSGGQLQRTAIARTIAKNVDIIFADEPTGALDEDMSKEVLSILIKITKQYNKTLIIVTHNPQIAKVANRVLRFSNGKIVKDEVNKNPVDPMSLKW